MVVKKLSQEEKEAMKIAVKKAMADNKILAGQIRRDTSRLKTPFDDQIERLKKKIQKLYMWIWVLLGLSALLFIIMLLIR